MYNITLLNLKDNEFVAELCTTSLTVAHSFIYDSIKDSWHGANYKIVLWKEKGEYYAQAIPHYENDLYEAFEVKCRDWEESEYHCIPDAIDRLLYLLEKD